jgi:c-di-GMP-binding flagellar brake protein YcgR
MKAYIVLRSTHVSQRDRRMGFRIPFSTLLTSFVHERPVRALASDLSDTGMRVHAVTGLAPAPGQIVPIELTLPDCDDSIWATAQVCHRDAGDLASGLGLRFVSMASRHARRVRDYCVESRRAHLGGLLARIRASA